MVVGQQVFPHSEHDLRQDIIVTDGNSVTGMIHRPPTSFFLRTIKRTLPFTSS